MFFGMLTRSFTRNAEKKEMTPLQIMSELRDRLEAKGYSYDDQANSDLKNKMISSMLKANWTGCEGDVCPVNVIFRRPPKYRYIAERAILERQDSAFGVKLTDKVRFVRENYYSDFPRDKDEPWPSVEVLQDVTVADILAEPHQAPVKNLRQRAVAAVREWFVN